MIIGVPKEIKKHEYRVGMPPSHAAMYAEHGHKVIIEKHAGEGAGFSDSEYRKAGASIFSDKKKIFSEAEMIVKVKEPLEEEYDLFSEGQILFTYLHLAANKKLTESLLSKKVVGIAYETIQLADGSLPCLTPMSEIAGRLAVQEGAKYLEKAFGGRGVLLGGVPGVDRGKVTIIGGGVVGTNAAKIAVGIGADVTILDLSAKRLGYLDDIFGSKLQTLYSNHENIIKCLKRSDLVIGAVLVPGAKAPKLVTEGMLKYMQKGAVIVDVAVDQGGCFETTRPTSHDDPTFNVNDVVHYCVANMPGAVALTSTQALTSVTLPYGLKIASEGWENALEHDPALKKGLNMVDGKLCYEAVASSLGLPFQKI